VSDDETGRSVGPAEPPKNARRRAIVFVLAAVACGLVITGALAVRDALRIARDVRAGRAAFHAIARDAFSANGSLTARTAAATAILTRAEREARDSIWLGGWSHVPLLGQPARWLRGTTASLVGLARVASDVANTIEPRLSTAGDPSGRLALIDTVSSEFIRLQTAVDAVHIPSTGWFLPPVDSADGQLRTELKRIRGQIGNVLVGARGIRSLLAGPTTYLVLAANNAEMRAGGMVLQAGTVYAAGGQIVPGPFLSTGELALKNAVAVPSEIKTLYGWLDPGAEWRNTDSSPNFPAVAPIYAAMAEHRADLSRRGSTIDGVIQLDVYALHRLLGVVGPVEVGGRRYASWNVERLVMHDLYVSYGSVRPEIVARHRELGRLAEATFSALSHRHWDPRALLKALADAGGGRHLLVWSNRPDEAAAWSRLGVDGALRREGLMVTIQNHSGNKLDWFLRTTMTVGTRRLRDGHTRVTLTIAITNPTPPNQPLYVTGDGSIVPPGTYRAFVAVYLPGWATDVELAGGRTLIVGPDGPMRVIGTRIDVGRTETMNVVVTFDAPPNARIQLLPSGRIPPMTVDVRGKQLDDAKPRAIEL